MPSITKDTIFTMNSKLSKYNLSCESNICYKNNKQKLLLKCLKCNFTFYNSYNDIQQEFKGCKKCNDVDIHQKIGRPKGIRKGKQIQLAKNAAINRGGKCLSEEYLGSNSKLYCTCMYNHQFLIKYCDLVNTGRWCPKCSKKNNLSEEICRAHFEQIFQKKFPTIRPEFLKISNGYRLELDGFNEELKIAFEHQGTQHYQLCFDKNPDKLLRTQTYDLLKKRLCDLHGVRLIQIPKLFEKTMIKNLKNFIKDKLLEFNIQIPKDFEQLEINLKEVSSCSKFDEYKNIAIAKGGRCISTEYFGAVNKKLIWECNQGHKWMQFPYVIKKGHWCPVCGGCINKGVILL